MKTFLSLFLLLAVIAAGTVAFGSWRWDRETAQLRDRLDNARRTIAPQRVDIRELDSLPAPVQRYFRTVLQPEMPMVASARIRHRGSFNMGASAADWKPFTSDQLVVTQRPGFDWNGNVAVAPGLGAYVHDAYVAGEGILHASVAGLFSVADMRGTRAVAEGELMRFLAESAWYPTALLPSQGVKWEEIDDRSANATLRDGEVAITLRFSFSSDGTIDTVHANARGRTVGDRVIDTPWQGRFWNYQRRNGMLVPTEGEVSWMLPEGPYPYWRGQVTELTVEFAVPVSEKGAATRPLSVN